MSDSSDRIREAEIQAEYRQFYLIHALDSLVKCWRRNCDSLVDDYRSEIRRWQSQGANADDFALAVNNLEDAAMDEDDYRFKDAFLRAGDAHFAMKVLYGDGEHLGLFEERE